MTQIENYFVVGSLLLILSIFANNTISRWGIPSLLVFLAIGMLAGSEGIGGLYFDNSQLAQTLGVCALIYILFAGGLETNWGEVKSVAFPGLTLSTVGVFVTSLSTGLFATYFLNLDIVEGMLLGAIVSSTDAAAVFTVLRSRGVNLKGRIKPTLELESGSNDPMAVFLTVGLIQVLTQPESSWLGLIPMFFQQMFVGAAVGYLGGKGMSVLLRKTKLDAEGLYPVLTLALVLLVYSSTQLAGGNGFLAVYLAGLVMGKETFLHKKSLVQFHDGIAWLMQITMFLTLGLLVFPSHLLPVVGAGLALSAFLIFIARPLSVFLSLSQSSFGPKDKLMISWVGLRGAVPIILATYPLLAGLEKAEFLFNLVFFVVLTSVLIQGTALPVVAKWLKVDAPLKPKFRSPIDYSPGGDLKNDLVDIEVPPGSQVIGQAVIDLQLPKDLLIVLIQRGENVLVPRGATQIAAGDHLLILADRDALRATRLIVEQPAIS